MNNKDIDIDSEDAWKQIDLVRGNCNPAYPFYLDEELTYHNDAEWEADAENNFALLKQAMIRQWRSVRDSKQQG